MLTSYLLICILFYDVMHNDCIKIYYDYNCDRGQKRNALIEVHLQTSPIYLQLKTFEEENIHEFCSFRPTYESFLLQIWACHTHPCQVFASHESFLHKMAILTQSTKVFTLESFPAVQYIVCLWWNTTGKYVSNITSYRVTL